ncbi:hypothetical protein [Streptomyces sp. NPDC000395]|uniref:hypothetical protein n=1 Tax=Streptomyces sp. NPDC000395 TaxID=3154252 RepID=UPI00336A23FF
MEELTTVAERHRADHEVHHVATDLAHWSRAHLQRLADTRHAHTHDLSLGDPQGARSAGLLSALGEKAAEALGHRPEPGFLLLHDLRDLHLRAAQAIKDLSPQNLTGGQPPASGRGALGGRAAPQGGVGQ